VRRRRYPDGPQVRPIGFGRVDGARLAPGDRLAPRRDDDAYTLGHRVVRIGIDEFAIAFERVALQRECISLLRADLADRLGADRRGLLRRHGRRRRVGRALEE